MAAAASCDVMLMCALLPIAIRLIEISPRVRRDVCQNAACHICKNVEHNMLYSAHFISKLLLKYTS